MNPDQVKLLKAAYDKIHFIEQGSQPHRRAVALISGQPTKVQLAIEEAGIRWLSPIARNIRMGNPLASLPGSGQPIQDQGRGYL